MASQTLWAAFVRAMAAAFLAFAGAAYSAFLSLDAVAGVPDSEVYKGAILAGVGAALATFGWRAGAEGSWDAWRQAKNLQSAADVSDEEPPRAA